MTNELVSIIVPVYQAENFMCQCIDSLLQQSYSNVEIILVNDGSEDRTLDICRRYEDENRNVVVVDLSHGGVSKARNAGLKMVRGEYFTFVDSDDWVEKNYIEEMVSVMSKEEAEIAVCGYMKYYNPEKKVVEVSKENQRIMTGKEMIYSMLKPNGTFTALWNKMYSSKLLLFNEGMHLFDEELTIGEDEVWLVGLLSNVKRAVWVEKALYVWNQREGSITHTKKFETWKLSELDAKRKVINLLLKNHGENEEIISLAKRILNICLIRYTRIAYFAERKKEFHEIIQMRKGKVKFFDFFYLENVSLKFKIKVLLCDIGIRLHIPANILRKFFA